MATYPGTYVTIGTASTSQRQTLIDQYFTPRLLSFRQIRIFDEPCALKVDRATWAVHWGNWCDTAPLEVRKGGAIVPTGTVTNIDFTYGTFQIGAVDLGLDNEPRDAVEATYWFDYFPVPVLEGLLMNAVNVVNTAAFGSPTSYTLETMPSYWAGVVVDVAFAMAMERMLLDYDLWRYRLIFALSPNDLEGGGGDITNQLTTLKQNAEDRANRTLENEKFKTGNYLSPPTAWYYDAIRGLGVGGGAHGVPFVSGRLRGWKANRYL